MEEPNPLWAVVLQIYFATLLRLTKFFATSPYCSEKDKIDISDYPQCESRFYEILI